MTSSSPDPVLDTSVSYERGAAEYAEHSRDRTPLAHLLDRFATLVGPNALVLDLGCGPGHDAAELAKRGLRSNACDLTLGLLRQARLHDAIVGRLVQCDARQVPFAADSLDGVWACASLLHLRKTDVPDALLEAHRALKLGGILFTSMQHGEGEKVPYDPGFGLGVRHYFFYRAEEWQILVEQAGFNVIDQRINATTSGLTPGATGWIETFARKT